MWAVMDIGTNSCRLLLADCEEKTQRIQVFEKALIITRIGEGMNTANRFISSVAMERTIQALKKFSDIIGSYHIENVRIVATQAVREALNKEELVNKIGIMFGWQLEIIQGKYEAELSYLGATYELKSSVPPLIIDIGGGSTEFIYKGKKQDVYVMSLPFGALRILENPINDEEMIELLTKGLGDASKFRDAPLVAVGGTVTTIAAVKLELVNYDANKVQGLKINIKEIMNIFKALSSIKPNERLEIPGITGGREDIIISGMQILINIMKYLKRNELIISDYDLLQGLIYETLER